MNITKLAAVTFILLLTSCVSQKKYTTLMDRANLCKNSLNTSQNEVTVLENSLANEKNRAKSLEQQIEYFKSTNTDLLARLSDLSVVSKSGAESIKQSLEALNEQNKYIKDLTTSMRRKDSINLVLVMNLKRLERERQRERERDRERWREEMDREIEKQVSCSFSQPHSVEAGKDRRRQTRAETERERERDKRRQRERNGDRSRDRQTGTEASR